MKGNRYPSRIQPERSGAIQEEAPRLFIERRKASRVTSKGGLGSFSSPVGSEPAEGDAILLNISLHGCQLDSEQILPQDHPYQLIVYVPPHPSPILIRKAATRWREGRIHGITFIDLAAECRLKLKEAIQRGPVVSWVQSSMRFGMWSIIDAKSSIF